MLKQKHQFSKKEGVRHKRSQISPIIIIILSSSTENGFYLSITIQESFFEILCIFTHTRYPNRSLERNFDKKMERHIKNLQNALASSSPDRKSASQRVLFHALFATSRALRGDVEIDEENRTKLINLLNSLTCPPQLQLCTIAVARIIPQCYFLLSEPKSTLKTAKRLQRSMSTSSDDQTLLISTIVLGGILKLFGRKLGRGGNFVEMVDMLKNSKFSKHTNPSFHEALMKCLKDCCWVRLNHATHFNGTSLSQVLLH